MNGLSRAFYHRSGVKLGIKDPGSPTIAGLDQAKAGAALNSLLYSMFSAVVK